MDIGHITREIEALPIEAPEGAPDPVPAPGGTPAPAEPVPALQPA
jgi:hypothetical protein